MAFTYQLFGFFLSTGDTWTETLAYVLFWGVASVGTFFIILYNGKDFVDAPRLVQKEKIDWVCVCGKRLGLEDSILQNWSLYWPAFHRSRGLRKPLPQSTSVCAGRWLTIGDLPDDPTVGRCVYNLKLFCNSNITWIQLTDGRNLSIVSLINYWRISNIYQKSSFFHCVKQASFV